MFQKKPKVGFLPLGDREDDEVTRDALGALKILEGSGMQVVPVPVSMSQQNVMRLSEELAREDIDLLVIFVAQHRMARLTVMAAENVGVPTVIWAVLVRHSLTTASSAFGNLKEKNFPVRIVCARPQDTSVQTEILLVARVAYTVKRLKRSRIGTIGCLPSFMVASHYNEDVLRQRLGPEVIHIPIHELSSILDQTTTGTTKEKELIMDKFEVLVENEALEGALRLYACVRKIIQKYGLHAIALACSTELNLLFGFNPCLGHIENQIIGCEGDVPQLVGALMIGYLTGKDAFMADLYSVDYAKKTIVVAHCSAPASFSQTKSFIIGRKGMTFCRPRFPHGPVTIFRLFGRNLDQIQMTSGVIVGDEIEKNVKLEIRLRNVERFVENITGNHYLIVMGNVTKELRHLCNWLKLRTIEI